MKRKVLITGGAGFLGTHLCEKLLIQGCQVFCIDNFYTGVKRNLHDHKNFYFMNHDVVKEFYVEVDEIYHLACPASPIHYQKNSVQTIKTAFLGTLNALNLAKQTGAKILIASTSEVYGDPVVHPQTEDYWGNVNPIGSRACFAHDVEVLTFHGWKLFSQVLENDMFATINENGILEFQKSIEIIKQRYIGELLRFKNKNCDLLVTPNHKMYVRKRNDNIKKPYELIPAFENISWSRSHMLKIAPTYNGEEKEWFYFPPSDIKNSKIIIDKIKMDDWLEFLGYFISEGSADLNERTVMIKNVEYSSKHYRIAISQSKIKNKENWDKIKSCLDRLPYNYSISNDAQFFICNKQLYNYLKILGKSSDKYIPREFLNLSRRQLNILFDALMVGDGNKRKNTYYSSSIKLLNDFQELLLKIGLAGNISQKSDTRKLNPVYSISILRERHWEPTYSNRSVEQYDGFVYCVSVPNHTLFVRRNGKALFCGNCYDESKRCGEALAVSFAKQYGVDVKIIRIFNTYGPKMSLNDGRVMTNFITQAITGNSITIYGDGTQTRSFCYVSDMISGIMEAMRIGKTASPINLGNPSEISMIDLANIIIYETNSISKIEYVPLPEDDPKRRKPDISKAKKMLNWEPKVSLNEGIIKTISDIKLQFSEEL